MLKVSDLKFPVVFVSIGSGEIRFDTAESFGVWVSGIAAGGESTIRVSWFVHRNRLYNPDNRADRDYFYYNPACDTAEAMVENAGHIAQAEIRDSIVRSASITGLIRHEGQVNIESATIQDGKVNSDRIQGEDHAPLGGAPDLLPCGNTLQCKIEQMPLGAKIKAVQNSSGEWEEFTMEIRRVEVHEDIITLMTHYGTARERGYGVEANFKRGTWVRYAK